ncbi:MAG: succinic semialdehyde dehydrogenase [Microbacteriaceae bacterium]
MTEPQFPRADVVSPIDGVTIGSVALMDDAHIRRVAAELRAAQPEWARVPLRDKVAIALRFHDLVLREQDSILDVAQAETGKTRYAAFEELADAAGVARYYARTARRALAPSQRRGAFPVITRTTVHHLPRGVVGVVAPWNYPITMPIGDTIPALLAGNTVMVKPDLQTSLTAHAIIEMLYAAGVPRNVVRIVTGEVEHIGTALIESVDFMMFTGSTASGMKVAEQCGRLLTPVSLELGGKNPLIVLPSADIRKAAAGAVRASFANAGQLCMSMERIYVHDTVLPDFLAEFRRQTELLTVGVGLGWHNEMGSLISAKQLDTFRTHVDDAVRRGATVVTGGRHRPDIAPYCVEPTVLSGVTEDMLCARAETFGPLVSVYPFSTEEEVIALANDTDYGLNASVWGEPRHARRIGRRIMAGTVNINEGYSAAWASYDAPMGGMKNSGLGRRHGPEGLLKYTNTQTVAVHSVLPIGPGAGADHHAYARFLTLALRTLRRLPFLK